MKPSNYNFLFPYEEDKGKGVIYNARTNALALLDEDKLESFKTFCLNENDLSEEFASDLKKAGFILDSEVNEKSLLQYSMLRSRYNTERLHLTIAPTHDCNFGCIYCYEKDVITDLNMSKAVQDRLIEYVKQKAKYISNLSIVWYGGEPLLTLDTIEYLTKEFKALCAENDISYSASMITNGYLLTPKVARLLKSLDVSAIQITLDGISDVHNKRRPLFDGSETFETIVNNIKDVADILPNNIVLRINIDKDNTDSLHEIEDFLVQNKLLKIVQPYLGNVENANECYNDSSCLLPSEFSKINFDFNKRIWKHDSSGMMMAYPIQRTNYCSADSLNSLIISADGSIYKCYQDIGNENRKTGSIMDASVHNQDVYQSYMLYDATLDPGCSECKYLPVCMGNCPFARLKEGSPQCAEIKYSLDAYMSIMPQIIRNRKQKAKAG